MAGHAYVTTTNPETLEQAAINVAGSMGFGVKPVGPGALAVTKGSLVASIFVGAFVAYCEFRVNVSVAPDGTSHLVLERNSPWWTGVIGVSRVKKRARELADAIGNELIRLGVQIVARNDF